MMRLFAKVLMLVGCLTISTQLLALGLGELKLHSALNQPLDAEIELVDAEGLSQWEIKPFLASSVAFERAGVERPYFLTKIRFKVEGEKIRLTTKDSVTEPFLNFLIELNWPSGRVLREYTVLLDPPTFAEDNYQPLATAPSSAPMQTTEFQGGSNQPYAAPRQRQIPPAPGTRTNAAPARRDVEVNEAGQETYQVKPNDTLWSIALRTRPSSRVTPQQMMVAIQDENPDAFIAGNINRLKTHHVLRIPDQDQVSGISFESAVTEVARQNQDAGLSGAQLDATGRDFSTGPDQSDKSGGEVKLVSAQAREARSAGASGDVTRGSGGRQEALENELAISLENLDKSRRENKELRERLADLSEQIDDMQRLISLKDSQLASLQATTAQQNQQADAGATLPTAPASSATTDSAVAPATTAADEVTQPAVAATETAPVEPKPAPRKFVPPPPPPPPPSFIDTLLADTVTLAGGLAALLLLAGLSVLYLRKRKEAEAEDTSSVDESAIAEPISLDDVDAPERVATADDQNFDDLNNFNFDTEADSNDNNDLMADVDLGGDLFADPTATDTTETDDSAAVDVAPDIEDDGVDVSGLDFGDEEDDLFELVDLDVAYGRFDDAVDRLQGTLEAQPGRSDVRLRLLELLVEMGDAERFVEQENAVIESGDPELTQQASDLRQLLSDPIEPTAIAPSMDSSVSVDDVASDIDISIDQMGSDLDDGVAFGDALDISDSDPQADNFSFDEEETDTSSTVDDELLDLETLEAELEEDFGESVSEAEEEAQADGNDVEFDLSSLAEQLDDEESAEEALPQEESPEDDNLMDFDLEAFEELEEAPVDEAADAEDLFDEESSMDFDVAELELPSEDDSTEAPAPLEDDENAMDFDVAELNIPSEEELAETTSEPVADDENSMEFDLTGLEDAGELEEAAADDVEEEPDNLLEFDAEDVVTAPVESEATTAEDSLDFDEDSQVDFDLGELDELSDFAEESEAVDAATEVEEEASLDSLAMAEESLEALMDADGDDHGEFDLAGLQSEYSAGDDAEATDDLAALDAELSDSDSTLDELEELPELDGLDDLEALPELESVEDADDDLAALDAELSDADSALDELEELPELDGLDELEALPELESVEDADDDLAALDAELSNSDSALDELEELPELDGLDDLEALPELESVEDAGDDLAALDAELSDADSALDELEELPELPELDGLDELEALPELESAEDAGDDLATLDAELSDADSALDELEELPELDGLDDLDALPELESVENVGDDLAALDAELSDSDSALGELEELPELDGLDDLEALPELESVEDTGDDLAALNAELSDSDSALDELEELPELDGLDDLDALPELESVEDAGDDLAALDELEELPELDGLDELEELPELESVEDAGDDLAALDAELSDSDSALAELEALPELESVEDASDNLAALDAELSDSDSALGELEELPELDGLDELEALPELESVEGAGDDLAALDAELSDSDNALEELPELDDLEALPELEAIDELPELEPLTEVVDTPAVDEALPQLDDLDELPELEPETAAVAAVATVAAVAATRTNDIDLDALAQSEDEFDFLAGTDECDTKLELAQEYLNMDDEDGARELLNEVVSEGTDAQIKQARELLDTFA